MNLFFYLVNTNCMKKNILFLILLIGHYKVCALEDIKIDNQDLIPKFNKNIFVYNYFTNNEEVKVNVKESKNETSDVKDTYNLNEMNNEIKIKTSNNQEYIIHISKNYNKNMKDESYIKDIKIEGYEINFDKNIHDYNITINDESNLIINCDLSNDNDYLQILGNGNFNKSENLITIILNNETKYYIHVYKTLNVSKNLNEVEYKEMSKIKKEIVKFGLVTISCIMVMIFYYILFINKTTIHI